MNKQDYKHIRNLAWDLLIDAKITSLPTNVTAVAKLYYLEELIDNTKSLYGNSITISSKILEIFGYNTMFSKYLAIRLLSPLIVINELNLNSYVELSDLTKLPVDIANQRFKRYQTLVERNKFKTSSLEAKVLNQFKPWIEEYKHQKFQ